MRTKNSIRNIVTAFSVNLLSIIVGLVVQAIFIKTLGVEYLGLNGLFSNLISMLSIAELGFGSAIIFSLYKPIADKEYGTINSLLRLYKRSYSVISLIMFIIGLLIIPFLPIIVGDNTINGNINMFYLLFLIDVVISYVLSYKRSILIADQKNYLINIIHVVYFLILNSIQIFVLLNTKNFYLFLIMKITIRIAENIFITMFVNRKYSYLSNKNIEPLDDSIFKDIIKKIKALFIHKIAAFIVLGTDNILISMLFGLNVLGLYANYYLIINAINSLVTQIFSSVVPSIGNLNVTTDKNKKFEVYKNIRFINVWISIFAATSLFIVMDNFINIWLGSKYLLNDYILFALIINYYFQSTRLVNLIFKEAAGIFHEDRIMPILESIINIILSLLFAKMFGLIGIFMGTICSNLFLQIYSYPKYVYKKLFQRSHIQYFLENGKYLITFLFILFVTYILANVVESNLINNIIICLFIPNIIMYILYKKSSEMNYYKNLVYKFYKKWGGIKYEKS